MFNVNYVGFCRICDQLLTDPYCWVYVGFQWQRDGTAVISIDNVAMFAYKPMHAGQQSLMFLLQEMLFEDIDLD